MNLRTNQFFGDTQIYILQSGKKSNSLRLLVFCKFEFQFNSHARTGTRIYFSAEDR